MENPSGAPSASPLAATTGAESEYQHLLSYFKYLVTLCTAALTLIIAVGGVLFYRNMAEVREDASRLAQKAAIEESRKKVEEAFEQNKITDYINEVAARKVAVVTDKQIERQLQSKLEPVQRRITDIGEIAEHSARARLGFRAALIDLQRMVRTTNDEAVREFATSALKTIAGDYETRNTEALKKLGNVSPFEAAKSNQLGQATPIRNLHDIVVVVRTENDLNWVAAAFLVFRELSGSKVKAFDFEGVEQWCTANRPKCE